MIKTKVKNNKGFALLFSVMLSSIILAIALGVANISFKEIRFGTNARDTNEAFFAADTGIECALFYDKPTGSSFPLIGPASPISCAAFTPVFSGTATTGSYDFIITGLGVSGQGCAKVNVFKNITNPPMTTKITSRGYNIGDSSCDSSISNRVERQLESNY